MQILVKKTPNGLQPVYESDSDNYDKIRMGETFVIEIIKKRNPKLHRKFHALIKLAFDNQRVYKEVETMRQAVVISAGYYTMAVNKETGQAQKIANSINFENMDEYEFNDLYQAAREAICQWIGISNEQLEKEIIENY